MATLNHDGKINTLDLGLFKKAIDPMDPDQDLKEEADFNGDGKINTLDLGLFKQMSTNGRPGPSGLMQ